MLSFQSAPAEVVLAADRILSKQKESNEIAKFTALESGADAAAFTDESGFKIRTLFDMKSDTVRKRVMVRAARETVSFDIALDNGGAAYRQTVHKTPTGEFPVYYRDGETILYLQGKTAGGEIISKEWTYATQPNSPGGSRYVWRFESDAKNYGIAIKKAKDGGIEIYKQMTVAGLDPKDLKKKQSVFDAVRKAFKSRLSIRDEELITRIPVAVYWTAGGAQKTAEFECPDDRTLTVRIDEAPESYPLLIDPSLRFGQWLGSEGGLANITSMAINTSTEEIYCGGHVQGGSVDETVTFQGTPSGGKEGFVVEIQDGASPTLNWGQWLGGSSDDEVHELAVNGDEIYAGGNSYSATGWEPVTFQGSHSGSMEAFVIEIGDGATPTLNWGQWLGGSGYEDITGLAVNGDEIYAGGYSEDSASWESVTFQGSHSGGSEGFVVEIGDGSNPTLNWGQWLGGTGNDLLTGLAVNGDEVYAAGRTDDSTSWESVTFQGAQSGTEGFVVEIADGATPTLNWGQWLGGDSQDYVNALAVNGDEIYAAGNSSDSTSWESVTFQGAHNGGLEGFVVEIADGATPALNWGQWLGGDAHDDAAVLAVTGDEIYVGGFSQDPTSWESVSFQGTHDGTTEGFVVEIADGTNPTLNWGHWLGGSETNSLTALAVNGNEIYVGGYSDSDAFWESVTFQGTHNGGDEGYVLEIADGATPTLDWGHWLGGGQGYDEVTAIAVNGNEIYAGGYSSNASATFESVTFQGTHSGSMEGFVIEIQNGSTPTLNWGQWLGGDDEDLVYTLAVNGDEIYAGGYSRSAASWESVTFQGSHSGSDEVFVVEIGDGTTPTLNWGQWLGGTDADYINALAVNGDEIYAGGSSNDDTSWESASFQGAHSGVAEGFVVEIQDGATPALNWGQWLGGTADDTVVSLAVNGDEIYAGGTSDDPTSWESITFQGSYSGGREGFVVEIADGVSPTLNWGQWLGGVGSNYLTDLAVNGDEIYAGGYTDTDTSWESVTFQGGFGGDYEGFVVEIGDGATPTLNWGQWLGGDGSDLLNTLAVNGDEIYAGGYSEDSASWESVTFQGAHSGGLEGFVVEIGDGATPTLNWGQWLGGSGLNGDSVNSVAVNGDQIFIGGYSDDPASWEPFSFQGSYLYGSIGEGFVTSILDDVPGGRNAIFFGTEF